MPRADRPNQNGDIFKETPYWAQTVSMGPVRVPLELAPTRLRPGVKRLEAQLLCRASCQQARFRSRALARFVLAERSQAAATQPGVSDRPALFFHSSRAKPRINADEVIILMALPHVLGRGFVRVGVPASWDCCGLNGRSGQDDRGSQ